MIAAMSVLIAKFQNTPDLSAVVQAFRLGAIRRRQLYPETRQECDETGLVMSAFIHAVAGYRVCPITNLLGIGCRRLVIQSFLHRSCDRSY